MYCIIERELNYRRVRKFLNTNILHEYFLTRKFPQLRYFLDSSILRWDSLLGGIVCVCALPLASVQWDWVFLSASLGRNYHTFENQSIIALHATLVETVFSLTEKGTGQIITADQTPETASIAK